SFYGESYVWLPREDASSTTELHLEFRTSRPDALLFLAGGHPDYLLVKLEQGAIRIVMDLGSGEAILGSHPGLEFNDLHWHYLHLSRTDRTINLNINNMSTISTNSPGVFTELNINKGVFLGAVAASSDLFYGILREYRGCLKSVFFNGMDVLDAAQLEQDPLHIYEVSWGCSSQFGASSQQPISFLRNTSFVAFKQLESYKHGRFTFDLKTRTEMALLFYGSGRFSNPDFIALELVDGIAHLTVNKGSGVVSFSTGNRINDANWHQLEVVINPITIALSVDGQREERQMPHGDSRYLDLYGFLYVGGVGIMARALANQHRLQSLFGPRSAAGSLVGCIQNFKMNGELYGFREAEVTKDLSPECLWTFPCTSNPCIDGASCVEDGHFYYDCICEQANCFREGYAIGDQSPTRSTQGIVHVQDLVVQEGGVSLILNNNIEIVTDYAEFGIRDSDVVFRMVGQPEHGLVQVEHDDSTEDGATLFSMTDVLASRVSYSHDGSESRQDGIALELEFLRPDTVREADLPEIYRRRYGITLAIDVMPWNDKPDIRLPRDDTLIVVTNTQLTITPRILLAMDRDDPPAHLEYTVHYQHGHDIGYFEITDGLTVRARIATFTQEDVNDGRIAFVHRGSASQQIRIQVSDRKDVSMPKTLHVRAVPMMISVESNTGLHVPKGSSNLILKQNLSFTTNTPDQDFPIRYEVTVPPFDGEIQRQQPSNNQWVVSSTFTQQEVDSSRIRYFHYGGDLPDDFFKFKVYVLSDSDYIQEYDFDIVIIAAGLNITRNVGLHLTGMRDGYITENELMTVSSIPYHTPGKIVYSILSLPRHGHLYRIHQRTKERIRKKRISTNFTQADINGGDVLYRLNRALLNTIEDSFEFRVEVPEMESEIATFSVRYDPVDSEIHFINNGLLNVREGSQVLVTKEDLFMDSPDMVDFTYTIIDGPHYGVIQLVNPNTGQTTNRNATSFTNGDVSANKVYYKHDDSETTEDFFTFTVTPVVRHTQQTESLTQEITEYSGTFEIKISLRNDNSPRRLIEKPFDVVANRGRLLTLDDIKYTDPDVDFDDGQLLYTFRHIANGEFVSNSNRSVILGDFIQEDIAEDRVYFHHFGANNDKGTVMVSDGEFQSIGEFEVRVTEPYIKIVNNTGLAVKKGSNVTITTVNISIETNVDGTDKEFKFIISEPPKHGFIKRNTNERNRFNLAELRKGQVKYQHDNTEFMDDRFKFLVKVGDTETEGVVKVKILLGGEYLPLSVIHNRAIAVREEGEVTITRQELLFGHPEAGPADITYRISKQPQHGVLILRQSEADDRSKDRLRRFTQKDINDDRLVYTHTGQGQATDVIGFEVSNGVLTLRGQEFVVEVIPTTIPLRVEGFVIPEGGMKSISANNIKIKNRYFAKQHLEYSIVEGPRHGRVVYAENREQHVVQFSHQQVLKRKVLYIHDDTDTTGDNITLFVRMPDTAFRSNPQTIDIQILPTNDQPPRLVVNEPLRMWIGSVTPITTDNLKVEDADTPDNELMFIIGNPTNGDVTLKGNPNQNILNFTQDHINRKQVMFLDTRSQFDFRVSDGESYTDPTAFIIEAMPLVLSLEKLHLLEAYPGIYQPITSSNLKAVTNDLDNSRPIYYTLQSKPNNGHIVMKLDNGTETDVTSFSQDDIGNGCIFYYHTSGMVGWTDEDSFIFEVSTMYADRISHKTFPIKISYDYVNEDNRDQLIKVQPITVAEGESVELRKSNLDISKIRRRLSTSGLSGSEVNLVITELPKHGILKLNDTEVKVLGRLSQRDINKNRVKYVHDDSDTDYDAFHFSLDMTRPGSLDSDAENFDTVFPIEIVPKNDQPFRLLTDDPQIELVQGFMANISNSSLNTEDPDTLATGILYVVITGPHYGHLVHIDDVDESITEFTQDDINQDKIWYLHNGSRNKDSFYFKVSDGKHKPLYKVFVINVHPLTLEVKVVHHLEIKQGLFSQYLTADTFHITTNGNKNRVMYNVTRAPSYGQLYLNNSPARHFSHQNVIDQDITYIQSDATKSMDDFEMTIYDSHNVIRGKILQMKVIADLKKGESVPRVPAGQPLVLTLDMLDASHLASITQSNPVYSVTEGPRLGRLYVVDRKRKRKRILRWDNVDDDADDERRRPRSADDDDDQPAEFIRFTHEDIKDGVVQYEPEDSTIQAPETDGFSFILKAKAAQPAHGSFQVTVLPSAKAATSSSRPSGQGAATAPSGGDPAKSEEGATDGKDAEAKKAKKAKSDHIMIVYIVSAVTVAAIALIIIVKCVKHNKKKKLKRLEAMKEDSKTPLSQPTIQADPVVGYGKSPAGYEPAVARIPIISVTSESDAGSLASRSSTLSKTLPKYVQEYGSIPRHPNMRHYGGDPGSVIVTGKPPPPPRSKSPPDGAAEPLYPDGSRTVPTCKVTPLADGEECEDVAPSGGAGASSEKPEVGFQWENVDPELLQHCRTTNPVLHENKYWV
ncbi:hypothetical protein LSH36_316g03037, partial [Paralvinella palmiformis]